MPRLASRLYRAPPGRPVHRDRAKVAPHISPRERAPLKNLDVPDAWIGPLLVMAGSFMITAGIRSSLKYYGAVDASHLSFKWLKYANDGSHFPTKSL